MFQRVQILRTDPILRGCALGKPFELKEIACKVVYNHEVDEACGAIGTYSTTIWV